MEASFRLEPNQGKGIIQETYSANNLKITSGEVADIAHLCAQIAAVNVMELYSPKRFTALAERYKLRPGFAIGLCEAKAGGTHWDLTRPSDIQETHDILDQDEPAHRFIHPRVTCSLNSRT